MQAAVEFVALHLGVAQALRAFHFAVFGGFGECRQGAVVGVGKDGFGSGDVVFEFAVVVEVGVVEFVQRFDVHQQFLFVAFKRVADLVELFADGVEFLQEGGERFGFAEQAREQRGFFLDFEFGTLEAAQEVDHVGEEFACFARVFAFDVGQHGVGDGGQLFLCGRAEVEDAVGVGDVQCLCELLDARRFEVGGQGGGCGFGDGCGGEFGAAGVVHGWFPVLSWSRRTWIWVSSCSCCWLVSCRCWAVKLCSLSASRLWKRICWRPWSGLPMSAR